MKTKFRSTPICIGPSLQQLSKAFCPNVSSLILPLLTPLSLIKNPTPQNPNLAVLTPQMKGGGDVPNSTPTPPVNAQPSYNFKFAYFLFLLQSSADSLASLLVFFMVFSYNLKLVKNYHLATNNKNKERTDVEESQTE